MNIEQLLTPKEAAAFIGMSPSNFDYYIKKDRVPGLYLKDGSKKRYFIKDKLIGWKPLDGRRKNGEHLLHKRKYE